MNDGFIESDNRELRTIVFIIEEPGRGNCISILYMMNLWPHSFVLVNINQTIIKKIVCPLHSINAINIWKSSWTNFLQKILATATASEERELVFLSFYPSNIKRNLLSFLSNKQTNKKKLDQQYIRPANICYTFDIGGVEIIHSTVES